MKITNTSMATFTNRKRTQRIIKCIFFLEIYLLTFVNKRGQTLCINRLVFNAYSVLEVNLETQYHRNLLRNYC